MSTSAAVTPEPAPNPGDGRSAHDRVVAYLAQHEMETEQQPR
jgi:hypothetical protein